MQFELIKPLLNRRFKDIESIKRALMNSTTDFVIVIHSESDRLIGRDFMIDIEIGDYAYTIYYIRDNADYLFITEV